MSRRSIDEAKKGSAEVVILAIVEGESHHGYEIAKLIEQRSDGSLKFTLASLYATLYRMEDRGWIKGRWIEKAGQRRRCHYRITEAGRKALVIRHARSSGAADLPVHTVDELAAHLEDIYIEAITAGRSESDAFRAAEIALAES